MNEAPTMLLHKFLQFRKNGKEIFYWIVQILALNPDLFIKLASEQF